MRVSSKPVLLETLPGYQGSWDIPLHHRTDFSEKVGRYCFVAIVLNEGERIQKQIERMAPVAGPVDLVIVDGGSTDGSLTPETLSTNCVRSLLVTHQRGLSPATRLALAFAMTEGYLGVITIDGNGKDGVEGIFNIIERLDEGHDLVQGSRFVTSGYHEFTHTALDRAAAAMDERFEDQPEVLASLHLTLSDAYRGLSQTEEAAHHARESARLREAQFGWEHQETLWAHSQLASMLNDQSKFAEALALHERVLEGKRRVMGREHASTFRTERRIAELHGKLGNYQYAEALLRAALARQEQVLGIDHPDTRTTAEALARWLFDQGTPEKRAEAVDLARKEYQSREQSMGPAHVDTLTSLHVLATMLHQSGHAEEAEPMHRRLLAERREIFGEKHVFTLTSMNNLANCLEALGRDAEAIAIYRELVPMQRETLGVRDWITLASLQNFGATLGRVGEHGEALDLLEEVYEVGTDLLGAEHPRLLITLESIADNHVALGELEEAIDILRRLLEKSRKVIGKTHPKTLTAAKNLAWNLGEVGNHEAARQVWQDTVTDLENDIGPNDPRLAEILLEYGFAVYDEMKLPADAIPLLKRAETIYQESLGPDDKKTKDARLQWLTSRRYAGEPMTQEEASEAFRLFEEIEGRTMGEAYREVQEEEAREEAKRNAPTLSERP